MGLFVICDESPYSLYDVVATTLIFCMTFRDVMIRCLVLMHIMPSPGGCRVHQHGNFHQRSRRTDARVLQSQPQGPAARELEGDGQIPSCFSLGLCCGLRPCLPGGDVAVVHANARGAGPGSYQ